VRAGALALLFAGALELVLSVVVAELSRWPGQSLTCSGAAVLAAFWLVNG
jgi:hypothetical protein